MKTKREIHPHFQYFLDFKSKELIELYKGLRSYIFEISPECNEILYHTHALTSVYSMSKKLSDAFCMLPIYTNHVNLGFNKGALLSDKKDLLKGTGKLIRHINIKEVKHYRNADVKRLIKEAIKIVDQDLNAKSPKGLTISKIKIK